MKKAGWASALVAVILLAVAVIVEAQQPAKVPRVGMLVSGGQQRVDAFQQGLRELGYIEGKSIIIEQRDPEGRTEKYPELATELVRLKMDVIVTGGLTGARAAAKATKTIPIVIAAGGDPVRIGLVASLARPGGNITGSSALSPELSGKRLELLRETLPSSSRVGIFWNPDNPATAVSMEEAKVAAQGLRLNIQSLSFRIADDLEKLFSTTSRKNVDSLTVMRGGTGAVAYRRIINFAAKSWLPAIYPLTELA
jgi:putative ABC transport system substrate-binding protein